MRTDHSPERLWARSRALTATLALLAIGAPELAFADAREVDEPENLPPPKEPQQLDEEPGPITPASYRKSVTLEAALGLGVVASTGDAADTGFGLSGVDLGIGGFLNPQLAITGRFTGVLTRGDNSVAAMLFGGSAQYWLDDKLWVGGGAGLAVVTASGISRNGFGFDGRAGYTFRQTGPHAFHASVEVTPMIVSGTFLAGIAVLVGYQYL